MARASLALYFALLALLMSFQVTTSADPPTEPPVNPPEADAPGSPSPDISSPPAPPPQFPPSPDISSPPAPPPQFSPSPGPSPALPPSNDDGDGDEDEDPSPSPSPDGPEADAPAPGADELSTVKDGGVKPKMKTDDEGMSGGKKAGIVVGVFAFAGLAALGGLVYKKRKENIERAAYGSAVRREFL